MAASTPEGLLPGAQTSTDAHAGYKEPVRHRLTVLEKIVTLVSLDPRLHNFLLRLPKDILFEVMYEALEDMQGYNGQSPTEVIAKACGAEEITEGRFKLPKRNRVIKLYRDG